VREDSPESVTEKLSQLTNGTKFQICFPRIWVHILDLPLGEAGFVRAIVGGETIDLSNQAGRGITQRREDRGFGRRGSANRWIWSAAKSADSVETASRMERCL
jgi:hypothetical protein